MRTLLTDRSTVKTVLQDMSSVVSNVTMDTNPISPMLEEHLRMYHLVRTPLALLACLLVCFLWQLAHFFFIS